jgi:hypothetical protein
VDEYVKPIPLDRIDVPESHRPADPQRVADLARSIAADGLLQPPAVRHAGGDLLEPRYELIFGRHRLEACRSLGWTLISARVLDIDAATARLAMHAENLFRSPLSGAEVIQALAEWRAAYEARFPDDATGAVADPGFTAHAAAVTGVGRRHVQKTVRAGRRLSAEELAVLQGRDVPLRYAQEIGGLADEPRRKAIALIASGMAPKQALAVAVAPPGAAAEAIERDDLPGHTPEDEMDDERWLQFACGEALARLPFQDVYRRDALLWRRSKEALRAFRAAARSLLARPGPGRPGRLRTLMGRLAHLAHPREWPACGACGGTGRDRDVSECGHCGGLGYHLQREGRR